VPLTLRARQTGDHAIRIYEHGDLVWSVDRPMLHLGDGAEVPMRVTLIAVVKEGALRVKHLHYSVGSVNEDVSGRSSRPRTPA
jgi:hypothetical protein